MIDIYFDIIIIDDMITWYIDWVVEREGHEGMNHSSSHPPFIHRSSRIHTRALLLEFVRQVRRRRLVLFRRSLGIPSYVGVDGERRQ